MHRFYIYLWLLWKSVWLRIFFFTWRGIIHYWIINDVATVTKSGKMMTKFDHLQYCINSDTRKVLKLPEMVDQMKKAISTELNCYHEREWGDKKNPVSVLAREEKEFKRPWMRNDFIYTLIYIGIIRVSVASRRYDPSFFYFAFSVLQ